MSEVKQLSSLMDISKRIANTLLEDNRCNIDEVLKNYKYLKEASFKKPNFYKNINHQPNERQFVSNSLSSIIGANNRDSTIMISNIILTEENAKLFENKIYNNIALSSLEETGKLNWWIGQRFGAKLYPLICEKMDCSLLESIAIALWGSDDYIEHIGLAIKNLLRNECLKNLIYQQWKSQNSNIQHIDDKQWEVYVLMYMDCLTEINNSNIIYNINIDSIIIYLASHALKCPIFIYSNEVINSNESQSTYLNPEIITCSNDSSINNLSCVNGHQQILTEVILNHSRTDTNDLRENKIVTEGWYLPINLNKIECRRSPILLAYFNEKFHALAPMQQSTGCYGTVYKTLLPVLTNNKCFYKIHFLNDVSDFTKNLTTFENYKKKYFIILEDFLDIEYINKSNDLIETRRSILENMVWNNSSSKIIESTNFKKHNLRRKMAKSFSNMRRSLYFLFNHTEEPIAKNNDQIHFVGSDLNELVPCVRCNFSQISEYDSMLLYRLEVAAALEDNYLDDSHINLTNMPIASMMDANYTKYKNPTNSQCSIDSLNSETPKAKSREVVNKYCIKNAQLRRLRFTHSKSEDASYQIPSAIPSTSSNNEDVRHDCPLNNSSTSLFGKSIENNKSLDNLHCKVHNDLGRSDLRDFLSEEMVKAVSSEVSNIGSMFEKGKEFAAADVINECFVEKLVRKHGCE